jgi:hypothetical protein
LSLSQPLGDFAKQNGEKNFLIESLDYLYQKGVKEEDPVEFLLVQIGDIEPRVSLYTAISHVIFFKKANLNLKFDLYSC